MTRWWATTLVGVVCVGAIMVAGAAGEEVRVDPALSQQVSAEVLGLG